MADHSQTNVSDSDPTTVEPPSGKEKLERLKAQLFPPETKSLRIALALEALGKAKKESKLDVATCKHIAQHIDLEGY